MGWQLAGMLNGYAGFLREKESTPIKHQPERVLWVPEFLLLASRPCPYTFEQKLERFRAEVGAHVGTKPISPTGTVKPGSPTH